MLAIFEYTYTVYSVQYTVYIYIYITSYLSTSILENNVNNNNNLVINIYGDADSNTANKVKQAGKSILSEIKKTMNRNGTFR